MGAEELTIVEEGLARGAASPGPGAGQRVRVTQGVFAGIAGQAYRHPTYARWLIAVQPGVWLEIDTRVVETL